MCVPSEHRPLAPLPILSCEPQSSGQAYRCIQADAGGGREGGREGGRVEGKRGKEGGRGGRERRCMCSSASYSGQSMYKVHVLYQADRSIDLI